MPTSQNPLFVRQLKQRSYSWRDSTGNSRSIIMLGRFAAIIDDQVVLLEGDLFGRTLTYRHNKTELRATRNSFTGPWTLSWNGQRIDPDLPEHQKSISLNEIASTPPGPLNELVNVRHAFNRLSLLGCTPPFIFTVPPALRHIPNTVGFIAAVLAGAVYDRILQDIGASNSHRIAVTCGMISWWIFAHCLAFFMARATPRAPAPQTGSGSPPKL